MIINKPQPAVPEYLLQIAAEIFAENDQPERARARVAATLRRRFRGATKSDLLGRFSMDPSGVWLGDGPEQELIMNMYGFHVVKPVIRANQSAMMQARIECTVTPNSQKPADAGIASIGLGIYKYINNHPDYWSNNLESQVCQQVQTDPGCFIHTYHDPDAESPINISIDEYSDEPVEQAGAYACAHCGSEGPVFSEQLGQASDGQMPCLECDEMAEILEMPEVGNVPFKVGTNEYPAGNIVQEVVSAFRVRVDERRTKNGNLRKADWLEHHFLIDEVNLQAWVPYFDIGSPSEWSYPLKWEYSLETGTDLYLKPWTGDGMGGRRPQHEVRKIYMRPGRYRHYRAPADFVLDRGDGYAATDRLGNPMLSIKRGQSLVDLFPKGFYFVVANGRLLPIIEPCDLREEWAYTGFLNDSASFWMQPASELEELQRAANNLYTIEMQHLETASIITTHYDREWWDSDDFERGLSPTKEGVHIAPNDDIARHFRTTTPPQLNGVMQGMEFVRSLIPDVSGIQPAAIGAPQPGEPAAAQRLQRQSSLGLLTPSQQSKAECKSIVVFQHLLWAQRTRPLEWFQHVGSLYGQEWKEQDIDAFCNANLELALTVGYKEGSATPTSLIEQEITMRQLLLDVAQVAQFVPGVLDAETVNEMISKYATVAGVDYDFDDVEADHRLADSRYQKIRSWLAANEDNGMPEEELVELALADRSLKPGTGEDNRTHIEFWQDQARALRAVDDPDYPLISCCEKMIDRHREAIKAEKQAESEIEVEGHAPEIAAQAAAAQAAGAQQAQAQKDKDARDAAARAEDNRATLERQAMSELAKADKNEQDRALKERMHRDEVNLRAAEIAKPESGGEPIEPTPREKVALTAQYADLPPEAQKDALRDMGLSTQGVEKVHPATLEAAKIAASKHRSNGASK